jgi:hypothetical protein
MEALASEVFTFISDRLCKKNMEDENKTKQDLKCGHSLWRQMEERLAAPCKQTAPQRLSARLEKNTEKLDDHGSFSLHLLCKK